MKNFNFYVSNIFISFIPKIKYQKKLLYWLKEAEKYPKEKIEERIKYYISKETGTLGNDAVSIKNFVKPKKLSTYFFDLVQYTNYFKNSLKINFKFGDVQENQEFLTIVKSRPINHTGNSVLMSLNTLRHFRFIKDVIPFSQKENKIVWRGVIHKENRSSLVAKFHNHPKCNIGQIKHEKGKPEWERPFLSIAEQLHYKFILSIEGNDVATNLKWIMSSNSLCFMPTPKFETWYMEGKLVPNFHYVHIKDDYSDMLEKMEYYEIHQDEAALIIRNAQKWTTIFKDKKLEKILSLKILESYFIATNQ